MSLRDSSTYCRIGSGSLKKYRYRGSGIWKFEKSNAVAVLYTIKIWSFFLGVYHFRLSHILSDHWILPNTAIYYSCNWITTFSQPLRTAYLNQLVNLSISSNRLTSIPPGAFQGLTSLESSFPTTHQGPFSALSDIIPALVSLISLRFLLLSENMLSQVDNTDFASMRNSSLKTLELINCIISGMLALKASCLSRIWNGSVQFRNSCGSAQPHDERERTQSIGSVSVSFAVQWCNKFCLLRTSKNWICPRTLCRDWAQKSSFYKPRIRDLDLSACGIISIENGTFSQMPLLMRFNLARNGLEDIPPAVMVLPQLQWFSLRGNERNRMKLNEKLMKSLLAFPCWLVEFAFLGAVDGGRRQSAHGPHDGRYSFSSFSTTSSPSDYCSAILSRTHQRQPTAALRLQRWNSVGVRGCHEHATWPEWLKSFAWSS